MRKVYVGGAFTSLAAIVAAWMAIGVGNPNPSTSTCPLPAFPDSACTGIPVGTVLTPATVDGNGDLQVTVDGTIVDSVEVPRCVIVAAYGVVVKNSRMRCVFMEVGRASNPANPRLTVQDSEIDCDNRANHAPSDPRTAINNANYNAYRNHITNCENGFDFSTDVTILDNLVDELWNSNDVDGPHTDGVQSTNGTNSVIQHNTIRADDEGCHPPAPPEGSDCNGTSAINVNNSALGPTVDGLDIRYNLISGGTFTLYCPIPAVTNTRIQGNHFSTVYGPKVGDFGPAADCGSGGETLLGNVYHETGLPVTAF